MSDYPAGHTKNNMRCEETQELIPAYIDRELGVLRNVAVETHVRTCEACRSKHVEHSNLRSSIRSGAQYFAAPEHLKSRIKKQISEV
jgi:predicted anti-sigma-YlaC factor YlaD